MTPLAPQRIVVGVDGSLAGRIAARWAIEHAKPGDTIELLHAWSPAPATSEVGVTETRDDRGAQHVVRHELAHLEALARDLRVALIGRAERGDPRDLLSESDADLVVVGSDGRGLLSRTLLASVCSHLVHRGETPVVVVPFHRKSR